MKTRAHWTASAEKDFETCPAKYRWSYLFDVSDWKKLGYKLAPSRNSPQMDRGTAIHQTCEDYLLDKITLDQLHPEISKQWRILLRGLKELGAIAEQMWEFDPDWNEWSVNNDYPLWLRMKIDAHYLLPRRRDRLGAARVIDYKTGKMYASNREQMEIYALGTFAKFDDVEAVTTELWYFDQGEIDEKTFKRSSISKLARKWEQRGNKVIEATSYPEKKNRFCNWCPFSKTKGGPCTTA